ncbi:MAG: choice-of-anchor J domain-containing protein, partial [Duncaniella sp.]|nr:choice-of-anchor J domain-containing protein [Duncaniella sp.]
MKKQLFFLALAALAVSASGVPTPELPSRTPVATGSGLKQTTRITPQSVAQRRAAVAAENAVDVPFAYAMGKDSPDVDFIKANFTVVNANNDSRTWNVCTTNKYSSCMAAKSGESETADDWLITMPVNLTAGSYKLSFDLGFMGATATGARLEVKLGTGTTVDDMTQIIAPEVLYTAKDQTSYKYDFRVADDGVYYIGFHCTTTVAEAGAALLYNFGVEANASAPANAVEVPFKHELGKDSPVADFIKENYTTINANGDNRQWQVASVNGYSACMAPNADDVDANDDWFITMPIHMPAGNYIVAFDLGYMSGTGVILDVQLGTAPTVEAMTTQIVPSTTFTDKDQKTYEYNCTVTADGYYYIGFHCTTTKDLKSAVKLFNVGVKKGEVVKIDPPAAGTLTWELAPKGELKATVTYTAPTKTVTGADLEYISKVELTSRWTVDKFEFTDVTPGQVIVQEVPMYQGINNRFTGVAYVGDVAGEMVEYKSIFCGKDTPLAPENVVLKTTDDYTGAVLSWDPVGEVGENGGYVDPEAVTYYIFDAFGSYYDPAIAETSNTTITLTYPDLDGQDLFAYQVTAGYESNYSLDNASNIAIVGTPAVLPFKESFPGGRYEGLWALDPATSYGGQQYGTITDDYFAGLVDPDDPDSPAPLKSFDGDNGFFYWLPYEKDVMVGLMSLRADISKAANPVLEFRYQGQGSTIDILLASGTGNLELVKSID